MGAADDYKKDLEKTADSTSAPSRLRLSEQAALMSKLDLVMSSLYNIAPKKDYNNFATVEFGDTGHICLTNSLYRTPAIKDFFKKIPVAVLSSLIPSIKLYKIFYPANDQKHYSWRIPFDDILTENGTETSEYMNLPGQDSTKIEDFLLNRGRFTAIGIKSFSYKYVGTQPAEVNTNIEANLELFFNNIEDFTREISISTTDPRFITSPIAGEFNFAFSDLVSPSARTKHKKDDITAQEYNPKYFRIRAVCGYAEVTSEYLKQLLPEYTDKEISDLKSAINSAKVNLFLQPHSHDITFEEDGRITVKISYTAAIDASLSEINILVNDADLIQKVNEAQAAYDSSAAEYNRKIETINKDRVRSPTEREKSVKEEETRKETALKDLKSSLSYQQDLLYSSIFRKLLIGDKIYKASFPAEVLGVNAEGKPLENAEHQRLKALFSCESVLIEKTNLADLEKDYNILKPPTSLEESKKKEEAEAKGKTDAAAGKSTATKSGDKFIVNFLKFGDLFDQACESIKIITNDYDRPRIMLGDMSINLPEKLKNLGTTTNISDMEVEYKADPIYINLSEIPISFDMFNQFWMDRVVKNRRSTYPLFSFITEIITDIILPAISPSIFGYNSNKTVSNNVKYSTLNISVPIAGGNDIFTGNFISNPFNGVIDKNKVPSVVNNRSLEEIVVECASYVFLYCSSQIPNLLTKNVGNVSLDEADGIFHFRIGTDGGIVKKMSFSKVQTPFRRESRAAQLGNPDILPLQEIYDTEIDMFGNNIFRPGDFIYIEPLYFTNRSAIDIQNKLGLGGYYSIMDVSTQINENIFSTKLKTVLIGHIEDGKVV